MQKVKTVDEYVQNAPEELQARLNDLRKVIKEAAPGSMEKISYGMPYYGYKGRLVYFAYAKNHIGLYIPPPIIENHKQELKDYQTAKSTVQFPLDKNLPLPLIKKLVKSRVAWNDSSQ
jgi:uncharacterized protein YdhG (YjbR/CyaY superfamily)